MTAELGNRQALKEEPTPSSEGSINRQQYGAVLSGFTLAPESKFRGRNFCCLTADSCRKLSWIQILTIVIVVLAPLAAIASIFFGCPNIVSEQERRECYVASFLFGVALPISVICACVYNPIIPFDPPLLPVTSRAPNPNPPVSGGAEALVPYQGLPLTTQSQALRNMELARV